METLTIHLINGDKFTYCRDRYTSEPHTECLEVTSTVDDSRILFPWSSILYMTTTPGDTADEFE